MKNKSNIVSNDDVFDGANIVGGRFVFDPGKANEVFKIRFDAQCHTDRDKAFLFHRSTTMHQYSVRPTTSIATIFKSRIWTHDVTQAILKSNSELSRELYMRPSHDIPWEKGKPLKVKKPLFSLSDSGSRWNMTNVQHFKQDCGLKSTADDEGLFYKCEEDDLEGSIGTYVDNSVPCGIPRSIKLTVRTSEKSDFKQQEFYNVNLSRIRVNHNIRGFKLSQRHRVRKVSRLSDVLDFNRLRSLRALFQWLAHTRPDIVFADTIACPTKITSEIFGFHLIYSQICNPFCTVLHLANLMR